MSAKTFTDRQGEYLAFIDAYTRVTGRPPAESDIQRRFGVSPPSVHQMVLTLERLGLIRRRPSPLVGYLFAGVLVGPSTPGFVADQTLAPQLAEIGVILLMFGVGLHFSLRELLAVRTVAVSGAIGQIAVVTLLGFGLARL